MRTHLIAACVAGVLGSFCGGLAAAEPDALSQRIELLEQMLKHQQQQIVAQQQTIDQFTARSDSGVGEQRRDELRELVRQTLADVDMRSQLMGDVLTAGYDEGFFIRSTDDAYALKINTLLQFRYTGIDRGENYGAFGTGSTQLDRTMRR